MTVCESKCEARPGVTVRCVRKLKADGRHDGLHHGYLDGRMFDWPQIEAVMHQSQPFPHGISCPDCRAAKQCCSCGTRSLWAWHHHCVNGRCPDCCGKHCKHYGGAA